MPGATLNKKASYFRSRVQHWTKRRLISEAGCNTEQKGVLFQKSGATLNKKASYFRSRLQHWTRRRPISEAGCNTEQEGVLFQRGKPLSLHADVEASTAIVLVVKSSSVVVSNPLINAHSTYALKGWTALSNVYVVQSEVTHSRYSEGYSEGWPYFAKYVRRFSRYRHITV